MFVCFISVTQLIAFCMKSICSLGPAIEVYFLKHSFLHKSVLSFYTFIIALCTILRFKNSRQYTMQNEERSTLLSERCRTYTRMLKRFPWCRRGSCEDHKTTWGLNTSSNITEHITQNMWFFIRHLFFSVCTLVIFKCICLNSVPNK